MKKFFGIVILTFFCGNAVYSQSTNVNTAYSIYIHSFIKYIEWPEDQRQGDFIIGVLGNSSVISALQKMADSKKAGTQKIVVKKFKSPNDIKSCQVLFVPDKARDEFKRAVAVVGPRPTLIVTETEGYGKKGSGINFVMIDNKLAFELNTKTLEYHRLKVSKELSKLAIMI